MYLLFRAGMLFRHEYTLTSWTCTCCRWHFDHCLPASHCCSHDERDEDVGGYDTSRPTRPSRQGSGFRATKPQTYVWQQVPDVPLQQEDPPQKLQIRAANWCVLAARQLVLPARGSRAGVNHVNVEPCTNIGLCFFCDPSSQLPFLIFLFFAFLCISDNFQHFLLT